MLKHDKNKCSRVSIKKTCFPYKKEIKIIRDTLKFKLIRNGHKSEYFSEIKLVAGRCS